MDIFKQRRYLWITIIFLVLINLTALTLLWLGRPEGRKLKRVPQNPIEEQKRIQQLLKRGLGFEQAQTEQYMRLRRDHHDKFRRLDVEIRELKKEMFGEVLKEQPQPTLSDSLLILIQAKQAEIERLTFQHFLDLKNLCGPGQKDKLKLLMHEVFRQEQPHRVEAIEPPPLHRDRPPPKN